MVLDSSFCMATAMRRMRIFLFGRISRIRLRWCFSIYGITVKTRNRMPPSTLFGTWFAISNWWYELRMKNLEKRPEPEFSILEEA